VIVDIAAIAALAPVIPVLTIEDREIAVPLARALVKGGLPVLEITLRTEAALDALRAIKGEVPEAVVGAGTVLNPVQLSEARRAGAQFFVSPGCTASLAAEARDAAVPFLAEQGFRLLKFFPADSAGGIGWLKAVAAPLAGLRFCPTGGVGPDTAPAYLALANVACVGGSWVAPRTAVASRDWGAIERLAATASNLRRP
jgi:2-dehydro-3-deoxyphosphogluconate aldolase / (4S)-4-hydroxy-2-oxoglutarate aldolase